MQRPSVVFVVMAGGRGERLWPLVRARRPKVCLSPDGSCSLLQATIERLRPVWPSARWLVVTVHDQARAVRSCLPPSLRAAVLVEPMTRNTAACITLSSLTLAARDPRALMVVAPADHWIGDVQAFRQAVRTAIQAAVRHEAIVTIGVRPTGPQTGFGYLCGGRRVRVEGALRPSVFRLERFIEKPTAPAAARLLRRPRTYWNSGLFIGATDLFLSHLGRWLPAHVHRLGPLVSSGACRINAPPRRRAADAYRALEAISFDHGVMQHAQGALVVEGQFDWMDLGSWDAWARFTRAAPRVVAVDSQGVTIVGQARHLVATVGVRNLLIVHTPSATLVCRPDKVQDVREVVRRLSAEPALAAYR